MPFLPNTVTRALPTDSHNHTGLRQLCPTERSEVKFLSSPLTPHLSNQLKQGDSSHVQTIVGCCVMAFPTKLQWLMGGQRCQYIQTWLNVLVPLHLIEMMFDCFHIFGLPLKKKKTSCKKSWFIFYSIGMKQKVFINKWILVIFSLCKQRKGPHCAVFVWNTLNMDKRK